MTGKQSTDVALHRNATQLVSAGVIPAAWSLAGESVRSHCVGS